MAIVESADIVSLALTEVPIDDEQPLSFWLEPELVVRVSPTAAAVLEEKYPKPGPGANPIVHQVQFNLIVCGERIPVGGYLDDERIYAAFFFSNPPKTFEKAESIISEWVRCKHAA